MFFFFFFQKQLKEQAVSKKSEQDEEQTKPDKKPKALLDRLWNKTQFVIHIISWTRTSDVEMLSSNIEIYFIMHSWLV